MSADERATLKKQSNGHAKSRPIAFLVPSFFRIYDLVAKQEP